ncbi:hypothetical protein DPMN_176997 [Dreissena polymorpha]|uniref:Uncharacterized protein n=1 Tax=Dreissena polymorpha TaxID=45954 RepID=A0A9D4E9D8_DREPO|nr:hypothetical protein DPMN_176997 [Dreissena polymorpha]
MIPYLLKWEILSKRFAALEQLKHGLNTLQFLDKTRDLHEVEKILQAENGDHATAEYLKESLTKEIGRLNPRSERETNAKDFTLKCLPANKRRPFTSFYGCKDVVLPRTTPQQP